MLERPHAVAELEQALARAPVVLLTGPRQAGKSTLARTFAHEPSNFFDLEDPRDQARLAEPTLALSNREGLVILDEAQLGPNLFPILRVLVDADPTPGRFLVLGSASPDLVGLSAESLAGRVAFVELGGFTLHDAGAQAIEQLWFRGGYPRAFLADDDELANAWLDDYIATFLNHDLASLGFGMSPAAMRRFWSMLAHYHGQTWNGAELARSLDVSQPTVRRYIDALADALVVRQVQPWFENLKKRQVKTPRVFIRDSGILHRLLGIDSRTRLEQHPKLGASWEGIVIEHLATRPDVTTPWFWSTHSGAEVDLRLELGGRVVGVEVKRTDTPAVTPSMRSAIDSLSLEHLYVVHGGEHRFPLREDITAVPAIEVLLAAAADEAFSG